MSRTVGTFFVGTVYTNLALRKRTWQSSCTTGCWGGVPGRAVDGNTNTKWNGRSCTHTKRDRWS